MVSRLALLATCLLVASPATTLARPLGGTPVALVTAERQNELLAVSLPDGHLLGRVSIAADPETVAAQPTGPAVVVSPSSHTVTLLAWRSLRRLAVLRDFRSPQIAAITPDGEWAYITDSATGYLSVIELANDRIVDRVFVGYDAHHLTISPDQSRTWVALGESASTIVVLDTKRPNRPRPVDRFHPATLVHDVAFAPDGRSVWLSSAQTNGVSVLDATSHHLLGTIAAGPAPQHIAFGTRGHVYITSGYGSTIETADEHTYRLLQRATTPYGSFNLATVGDLVVTASLLNGTITAYNGANLARWYSKQLAPAARDLALSIW
jgi:DNA-binding beta-propeller fold protein YncE